MLSLIIWDTFHFQPNDFSSSRFFFKIWHIFKVVKNSPKWLRKITFFCIFDKQCWENLLGIESNGWTAMKVTPQKLGPSLYQSRAKILVASNKKPFFTPFSQFPALKQRNTQLYVIYIFLLFSQRNEWTSFFSWFLLEIRTMKLKKKVFQRISDHFFFSSQIWFLMKIRSNLEKNRKTWEKYLSISSKWVKSFFFWRAFWRF